MVKKNHNQIEKNHLHHNGIEGEERESHTFYAIRWSPFINTSSPINSTLTRDFSYFSFVF